MKILLYDKIKIKASQYNNGYKNEVTKKPAL